MLNLIKVLSLAIIISVCVITGAEANVFQTATDKGIEIFKNVKNITFILGGFGLVGLAFGAVFGRVNWKWFGALAFGLAVVAAAGAIIEYVTSSGAAGESTMGDFGDTMY